MLLETNIKKSHKKVKKIYLPFHLAIPFLAICTKDLTSSSTDTFSVMLIDALFLIVKIWK